MAVAMVTEIRAATVTRVPGTLAPAVGEARRSIHSVGPCLSSAYSTALAPPLYPYAPGGADGAMPQTRVDCLLGVFSPLSGKTRSTHIPPAMERPWPYRPEEVGTACVITR